MDVQHGFIITWTDKDGFELPLTEFGIIGVFPNKTRAHSAKVALEEKINDLLNPRVIYSRKTPWYSFKKFEKPEPPMTLPEYRIQELTQQKNTLSVKAIKLM